MTTRLRGNSEIGNSVPGCLVANSLTTPRGLSPRLSSATSSCQTGASSETSRGLVVDHASTSALVGATVPVTVGDAKQRRAAIVTYARNRRSLAMLTPVTLGQLR